MKINSYTIKKYYSFYENNNFSIPRFQRSANSWKSKDKIELLNSILNDYPIGLITTVKPSKNKISILDGLQRTTTLIEIYHVPWTFLPDKYFDDFHEKVYPKHKGLKPLKKLISAIKKFEPDLKNAQVYTPKLFVETLKGKKENISLFRDLGTTFEHDFINWCKDISSKIRDYDVEYVHVLEINNKHDNESMMKAFDKINSKGKKLNAFELLSGQWSGSLIDGLSKEFIEKYKTPNPEAIWSQNHYETPENSLMPHEFIKGLLKNIQNKLPQNEEIFNKFIMKEDNNSYKHIMEIIKRYLVLKGDASEIIFDKDLGIKLSGIEGKHDWATNFTKDTIKALENTKKALWVHNLKTTNKKIKITKSEILLIVLLYLIANDSNSDKDALRKWSINFILYHKLLKTFDKSSTKNILKSIEEKEFYLGKWRESKPSSLLYEHYYDTKETETDEFPDISKMFATLIYLKNNEWTNKQDHHYDHLVPKSKLKNWGVKNISTYANISVLTKEDNIKKSDNINKNLILKDLEALNIDKNGEDAQKLVECYEKLISCPKEEAPKIVKVFFSQRRIFLDKKINNLTN